MKQRGSVWAQCKQSLEMQAWVGETFIMKVQSACMIAGSSTPAWQPDEIQAARA